MLQIGVKFQPLEAVSRYGDTQLQVAEICGKGHLDQSDSCDRFIL